MKHHFSNRELAHVFVNQTENELAGERSGSGSNFSFVGRSLRSYQTEVARIYTRKDGARCVLMDSHGFSNSTQKQMGFLRRALRPDDLNVSACFGSRGQWLPREDVGPKLWEKLKAEAMDYAEKASRARGRAPFLLECAGERINTAEKVRAFFKLRNKPFLPDLSTLAEKCKEEAKKRAAAEARRQEKKHKACALYGPQLLALWRQHEENSPGAALIREKLKAAGASGVQWSLLLPVAPDFAPNAALRLSVERDRVETSQGAQVLVRTVSFLWAFCRHARATGAAVDAETLARFPRLDHYTASAIDAAGNLTAGCHRIPFGEVENIARELGLPPFNGAPAEAPTIPAAEWENAPIASAIETEGAQ